MGKSKRISSHNLTASETFPRAHKRTASMCSNSRLDRLPFLESISASKASYSVRMDWLEEIDSKVPISLRPKLKTRPKTFE